MQCCSKQVTTKFCPDCGKQMQKQKAKPVDETRKVLDSKLPIYEIILDKSVIGTYLSKAHLGQGISYFETGEEKHYFFDSKNSTRGIKFKLFNDLKINCVTISSEKSHGLCTVETLLIFLIKAKIKNPFMNVSDALLATKNEGFRIVECNPPATNFREDFEEYIQYQRGMEQLIDMIKINLYSWLINSTL